MKGTEYLASSQAFGPDGRWILLISDVLFSITRFIVYPWVPGVLCWFIILCEPIVWDTDSYFYQPNKYLSVSYCHYSFRLQTKVEKKDTQTKEAAEFLRRIELQKSDK